MTLLCWLSFWCANAPVVLSPLRLVRLRPPFLVRPPARPPALLQGEALAAVLRDAGPASTFAGPGDLVPAGFVPAEHTSEGGGRSSPFRIANYDLVKVPAQPLGALRCSSFHAAAGTFALCPPACARMCVRV